MSKNTELTIGGNCRNTQLFRIIAKIRLDHSLKDRHFGGCGTGTSKSARREVIRNNKYIQWI
jgi:hypothetical protein